MKINFSLKPLAVACLLIIIGLAMELYSLYSLNPNNAWLFYGGIVVMVLSAPVGAILDAEINDKLVK